MATLEQFQSALSRVEAATTKAGTAVTAISDRIAGLEDMVRQLGLNASQEQQLLGQLSGIADSADAVATSLEQMGKKPENPVPVDPPTPLPGTPTPTPEGNTSSRR